MARHKTQPNANRITICVDDITKAALQTAAGMCEQHLLDFVYEAIFDAVLTVAATRKVGIPIAMERVQPPSYKKVRQRGKLRKSVL